MTRTPYNTARAPHPAAQLVPPFSFRGVTMQVFPLVADMDRLQRFVDRFIHDLAPESVGQFRVSLPYVYLQIVHYSEMSVAAARGGWISQHEVNFTIPLAWYASDGGRLAFKDWAYLTPYMFVDSPLSRTTGRELGGWPKEPGYLEFGENGTIASVATGPNDRERRALVRIEEAPPLSSLLSGRGASSYPWAGGRGVTRSAIAWAIRSAQLLREGGLLREPPGSPSASQLLDRLARFAVGLHTSSPYWIALNLKQFPNPAQPRVADYQGLVATKLSFDRLDWISLVGRRALLLGDVTGGHRVELHECDDFPIVDTLALDVAATRPGAHGERVAVLAPVFPFRLEFDMTHPPGEVLAWRTPFSQGWRRSAGSPAGAARADDAAPRVHGARGGAAAGGEPRDVDADLLVLPLLADAARLQAFCAAYFDATLAATPYRVEAWGPYVYLVAARAAESSEREQVVEVLVPVRWYCDDVLRGVALVPVFSYADRADVAARRSEVEGIPTTFAVFASPRADRPWLAVLTEELSTPGQQAGLRPVVEIRERSTAATTASCLSNDTLCIRLEQERQRMAAIVQEHALPPEPALALPREVLTLKQFRDADDPASACYQGVVVGERAIERVHSLAELEHPIEVRFQECLSQPIVKTLGLQWRAVDVGAPTAIYILVPCRPFQARVSMRRSAGRTIVARAGSAAWIASPLAAVSPGVRAVEPQIVLESMLGGAPTNRANETPRMTDDHRIDNVAEGRRA